MPKLDACFFDVPPDLLDRDGDNEIVLKLKTDCQKIVSQSMWIRRRTPNREQVSRDLREGVIFRDMRAMPLADVGVAAHGGGLVVHNRGDVLAVMVLLDLQAAGEAGPVIPTQDNALMLLPGERREIGRLDGEDLPQRFRCTLRGWNVPTRVLEVGAS